MSQQGARLCYYRRISISKGKEVLSLWRKGSFHCWSQDHEEYESGPGHYPAAVVEDEESSEIFIVRANLVHFGYPVNEVQP